MSTTCTVYVNTSTSDNPYGSSGTTFTEINPDNDEILFSAGSDAVDDQEAIPSESQLSQAGIYLYDGHPEITIDRYFLSDNDAGILKEIHNMGSGNFRYVFAVSLSGATASEPTLHLFDDSDLDSIDLTCLGGGTANSSWFRGITTTDGLPGASWTGSRLAGSADSHYLNLNNGNGALSGADVLYCQLKVVIPASQVDAGAEAPVIAIKFATT